jgi:hypothetical protein
VNAVGRISDSASAVSASSTPRAGAAREHYCLPPLQRWDLDEVLGLIEQKKYFLLHAPRQTGKTSCLLALMAHSEREGRYRAVYANLEIAQTAREDVARGMAAICSAIGPPRSIWATSACPTGDRRGLGAPVQGPAGCCGPALSAGVRQPQPLVLLLDEVDALIGDTLISLLRQLRAGYTQRPRHFPPRWCSAACAICATTASTPAPSGEIITGGSAFNIKAKSLRLGDFDAAEVATLLGEHTAETGQAFTAEALARVWELTRGQPWLVNALAYEACFRDAGGARPHPPHRRRADRPGQGEPDPAPGHPPRPARRQAARAAGAPHHRADAGRHRLGEVPEDDIQYLLDLGLCRRRNGRRA